MAKEKQVQRQGVQAGRSNSLLEQVGLTSEEIAAVKCQGVVCQEARGRKSSIFKLRFRVDGRQRVQYLGSDPAYAETVREELRSIRKGKLMDKRLRSLVSEAKRLLRQSISRLQPLVEPIGISFHGRALRQARRP